MTPNKITAANEHFLYVLVNIFTFNELWNHWNVTFCHKTWRVCNVRRQNSCDIANNMSGCFFLKHGAHAPQIFISKLVFKVHLKCVCVWYAGMLCCIFTIISSMQQDHKKCVCVHVCMLPVKLSNSITALLSDRQNSNVLMLPPP